ncbi:CHAT domain-containing protein [Rhodoplanes sp. TEM]|uniref:CHAT domain-containing protein n=1 Tax=Rhodoplanes tepidamans TaxID=200616 RepID=A0ABT5JBD2_RHOTP|nr:MULTISPECIES: CHAT domain-containing protein [Rhodoplanes]MDC7786988.1 CHAT domain-containing protein [Rhodoplanes tepidamans]MDC7982871.1 CHAT domain-containing protein [Rhodoplanes sp. TEM]MDQ0354287.1 tetratricopeptide (TPR) repeat protein [Rhodoplanes tepidamans]
MARIRVPGERDANPPPPELGVLRGVAEVKNVQAMQAGSVRAAAQPRELDGLTSDTIVELTLDTGARFYHRYGQLVEDLTPSAKRGGDGDRDTLELPVVLPGPATRSGVGRAVIQTVRTFDIDLSALGDAAGGLAGKPVAEWFDGRRSADYGLHRWDLSSLPAATYTADDGASGKPQLLFIHGTGSSTIGGFGAFAATDRPWCAAAAATLRARYGDRILAFDHPTLSVSPSANARALLEALPTGARLHLVSHSRGGMIGELLCWPQDGDGRTFRDTLDKLKKAAERKGASGYEVEIETLEQVGRLLREKRPVVERFVRVACPAAGTTLASERLDRWLSLATSVLDLSGLGGSQVYSFLKGFLLAVIRSRTDPKSVPGLEAMMPQSLLTTLLNRPGVETSADLSVLAGDIDGGSLLARLGLRAVDWFYGGDHDLVVDTVSMYGGLARVNRAARFYFDKGAEVSHFNYFRNDKTLKRLLAGLSRPDGDEAGFRRLEKAEEVSAFLATKRGGGARPTVIVVPDCMGATLEASGKRLWIDVAALAQDGLDKLALGSPSAVMPQSILAEAYGALARRLDKTYDVVAFPYDWRLSLEDNGGRFAALLKSHLEAGAADESVPVRIVAHGTGGLVVLAGFAGCTELMEAYVRRRGGRILLLDIPRCGSLRIARLLAGQHRLTRHLALLSLGDEIDIVESFRGFPGLVDLLPRELLDAAVWARIGGTGRPVSPSAKLLECARRVRDAIDGFDATRLPLVQVNGTPAVEIEMDVNAGLQFFIGRASARTSATVAVPGRTWWAPAEPGELACYEPAFDAYLDLLASGGTIRLPEQAPSFTTGFGERRALPAEMPSVFPDEAELVAAALDYARRPPAAERHRTRLRVVHGSLAFARWPVAVGHYEGDTIAGSEAYLDRALNGRLGRRLGVRVYPGPIGTAEIVLDGTQSPPGAVIVGLGPIGSLTPGNLKRTVSRALRRYALAVREMRTQPADEMGLSMILIGTGEGGLRTRDALAALLGAIRSANDVLGTDAFTNVEFVELYRDRAIEAAHLLDDLGVGAHGAFDDFAFDRLVATVSGGLERQTAREDQAWWRRLKIEMDETGSLRFTDLTDRARASVSLVGSPRKVREFVDRAVTEVKAAGEASAAEVLYELLLPADFKGESADDRHRVLVIDGEAASYPWELLRRPRAWGDKPLSVRAGMVRQFTKPSFADRRIVTKGVEALVVGNPPTGLSVFPSLGGAAEEAARVRDLLKANGFLVTERIGKSNGTSSLPAILCGQWRIMHLAGHGAVGFRKPGAADGTRTASRDEPRRCDSDPASQAFTGMVLEGGLFFEPEDVAQMEAIPELVFLNCCYLGSTDPSAERRATARFHELAANLGTAFITLGARAVIAAGWAVDDAAAKRFAEVFYQEMFARRSFGDATLAARQAVYDDPAYANSNTWGAYQCYGDPSYRLLIDGTRIEAPRQAATRVHVQELISEIRDIEQNAQTLGMRDPKPLRDQLRTISDSLSGAAARWADDPEVLTALGAAHAALGKFDDGIAAYERALKAETAKISICVIEQLAQLKARHAARTWARAKPGTEPEARRHIEDAIRLIESLKPYGPGGDYTAARWCILGDCYKRLAQVLADQEQIEALSQMWHCFCRAQACQVGGGAGSTGALLNRLLAEALLKALKVEAPMPSHYAAAGASLAWLAPAEREDRLRRTENAVQEADQDRPSFENGVALADIALGRALLKDGLEENEQREIVAAYLQSWRRGASEFAFAEVLEQIEFVATVVEKAGTVQASLAAKLRAMSHQLQTATGVVV